MEEEILKEIENDSENEIIEIEESNDTLYDLKTVDGKNKKNGKKLTKKQKIIIIVIAIIFVVLVILGILFFVFKKDDKPKPVEVEKQQEVVIIKENYRYENGKLIFVESDNILGEYECVNKDQNMCLLSLYDNKEDDFDIPTHIYKDYTKLEESSSLYLNRYAFLIDGKKEDNIIILYDFIDKKEIGKYALLKKVDSTHVIVKNNDGLYALLEFGDEGVKSIIDYSYTYMGYIPGKENFIVKKDNNYLLIDKNNKALTQIFASNIKNYNKYFISIKENNKYTLYDYTGKLVIDKDVDYIDFFEDFVIILNGRKLFIYNDKFSLLNSKAVFLNTNNYQTQYIYDESKKLIETKEAYTITNNTEMLTVKINDNETNISIHEARLNGNFKYVNYLDGILYFYKDEFKTEQIGTYKCDSQNSTGLSSTEFNECFIAKESPLLNRGKDTSKIGYLPIYNERFVFIKDNNSIVVWDLKNSKKIVTYSAVDAGNYKDNNVEHLATESFVLVMAKNLDGEFGIVKLEKDSIKAFIRFDNVSSIQYLGNDFLVKKDTGYVLYDNTGKELVTSSLEIKEYNKNALKVLNSNKFDIITHHNKIIASGFDYIEFKDKYFVGISGSVINLYKYEENASGLISEEVTVNVVNNDYASSYVINGNKLIVGENTYTFNVGA